MLVLGGAIEGIFVGVGATGCALAAYWVVARRAREYTIEILDYALLLALALPLGFLIAWVTWLVVGQGRPAVAAVRTVGLTAIAAIPVAVVVLVVMQLIHDTSATTAGLITFPLLAAVGILVILLERRTLAGKQVSASAATDS